jgi:6-phosphogluconolactonase (cycloisomerase 2 family)
VATSADGRTLYISDPLLERILLRRIDTATGALSELSPASVAAGNNVGPMRVHRSGRFLYAAAAIFPSAVFAYVVDGTGLLSPVAGSPFAGDPALTGLALVP